MLISGMHKSPLPFGQFSWMNNNHNTIVYIVQHKQDLNIIEHVRCKKNQLFCGFATCSLITVDIMTDYRNRSCNEHV